MMKPTPPDFAKLLSVTTELTRLVEAKAISKIEFDRLLDEAKTAVGEQTQYLESILIRGIELGYLG